MVQQRTPLAEHLDHARVGVPHLLARKQRRGRQKPAVVADRVIDREPVALAHDEVFLAVARRGVHGARAALERDVLAQYHRDFALVERMAQLQALECGTIRARHFARAGNSGALQHRCREFGRQHEQLGTGGAVDREQRVLELRMKRDRLVGGQRPRRRRPDHHARVARGQRRAAEAPRQLGTIHHPEAHVDRRRGAILVLDLRLSECGPAVQAPVHGLVALVEVPVADDLREGAQLLRLVARVHREVGLVPVAHHAEADEVAPLHIHLLGRVIAALLAERLGVEQLGLLAARLLDLQFDRQAVAVPARHVGRVVAVERARLDDDVLQDLVHRVADVDRAVGVRRAVVQDERRSVPGDFAQLAVGTAFLPPGEHLRLAAGEVRLHREGGLGEVDGVLVVGHRQRGS